jgi:alpha-L-rhamnosidase
LIGALRAAERCAEVLNDEKTKKVYSIARRKLLKAIDKTWSEEKGSYPDSIHGNGRPSSEVCQHTSMFAVMFDIGSKDKTERFRGNLLAPPKEMTRIFSPFVMQFLYEALEKLGEQDAILDSIRSGFQPMVDAGAGTVWETFAGSTFSPDGFPTRSHCHAWASSPILFLNRIVLGIRQTEAGGKAFEISPWLSDLKWARGATATPKGPVFVEWKIKDKTLLVSIRAPRGVKAEFKPKASHEWLKIKVVCL